MQSSQQTASLTFALNYNFLALVHTHTDTI